ncbi:MAG: hypothetical protein LUD72_00520 [Bacteroidales bacterium]|nr:hypothetical protein [Bacteroidales bacterium]
MVEIFWNREGTVDGVFEGTFGDYEYHVYLIPATVKKSEARDLEYIGNPGVYFYLGKEVRFGSLDMGMRDIYVGQAKERKETDALIERIYEPHPSIEPWKSRNLRYIMAFTTEDDSWKDNHVCYIENLFYNRIISGRNYRNNKFRVMNGEEPHAGRVYSVNKEKLNFFANMVSCLLEHIDLPYFDKVDLSAK